MIADRTRSVSNQEIKNLKTQLSFLRALQTLLH
jgi:hypothetical protein